MSQSARLLAVFCFITICGASVASRVDLLAEGGFAHSHRRSLKQLSCFTELTALAGVVTSFTTLSTDVAALCNGTNATFRNFTGPAGLNVSCPVGGSSPCRCMNKTLELASTGTSLLNRLTEACGASIIRSFLGDTSYMQLQTAMNRFSLCRDLAGTQLRDVAKSCNLTCAALAVVGGCNNATFFNQTIPGPGPVVLPPPPVTPMSCLTELAAAAPGLIADVASISADLSAACSPSQVTFTNVTGPNGVTVPCPVGGSSPCACLRRTLDLALLSNSSYDRLVQACGLSAVRGVLGTAVVAALDGARGRLAVCESAGGATAASLGSVAQQCNISCASLRSVGACSGGNVSVVLPWLPSPNRTAFIEPCSLSLPAVSGLLESLGDLSEAVSLMCGANTTFANVTSPTGQQVVCPVGGSSPCRCVRRIMELTRLGTSAYGFMTASCSQGALSDMLGEDVAGSLRDTVTWFSVCDNATRPQLQDVASRCNITCDALREVGACGANRTLSLPDWTRINRTEWSGLPRLPGLTTNDTCTAQLLNATGLLPTLTQLARDVADACVAGRVNMTLVRGAGNMTALCPVGGSDPCPCVAKMGELAKTARGAYRNLAAACGVDGMEGLLGSEAAAALQAAMFQFTLCEREAGRNLSAIIGRCNVTCDVLQGVGNCSGEWPPVAAPALCDDTEVDDASLDFNFVFAEYPECALPVSITASPNGSCPTVACNGDVNCCPCLAKIMASLAAANATLPPLNNTRSRTPRSGALLRTCKALKIGSCALETFLDAAAACLGTNVTNSPRLVDLLQSVRLVQAGGPLSGLELNYSERGMGGNPPSPVIAVGPDFAMTIANSQFGRSLYRVYNKTSFQPIKQSFLTQFHRSNTICRTGPFPGIPHVLYDQLADIWLIMEVARNASSGEYFLCLLKSLTGVPYGLLFRGYSFLLPRDPGDITFSLMPDAYYFTTSESPAPAYALDRERLLSAGTLRPLVRAESAPVTGPQLKGLLPAHMKGFPRDNTSTCGFFIRPIDDELAPGGNASRDTMEVWQLCPNFATGVPTWGLVASVSISDFNTSACNVNPTVPCVRQPGGAISRLLGFSSMVKPRVSFRSFLSYDLMLASFSVDAEANHGAIMWVELRRAAPNATVPSPPWERYQDGLWSPDDKDRFLGSSEMDRSGNIALGYAAVSDGAVGRRSAPTFPSLYYTGRAADAPLGVMTENETLLVAGTAAATNAAFGGRSVMAVDPVDGCSFFFLGPWGTQTSRSATRVGMFRFPSCLEEAECSTNSDCDDGQFCTVDKCRDGRCVSYPDVLLCRFGETCDEVTDTCRAAA